MSCFGSGRNWSRDNPELDAEAFFSDRDWPERLDRIDEDWDEEDEEDAEAE